MNGIIDAQDFLSWAFFFKRIYLMGELRSTIGSQDVAGVMVVDALDIVFRERWLRWVLATV